MKKMLSLIILLSVSSILAQAPQKMSYQAIIRNSADGLVVSSNVGMKVSIIKGTIAGSAVYVETHTGTTNVNGLLSIEIGSGSVISGTFSTINWGNDSYFIKTETDPDGGSNYTITGTSQLLSVPYALYAENIKSRGKNTIILKGDITDAEAAARLAKDLGPDTQFISITNTTSLTTVNIDGATELLDLTVSGNSDLTSLTSNTIETVLDRLTISGNPSLTSVSFPALNNVSGFWLSSNHALQSLNFPSLINADGIDIANNTALSSLNFPSLIKANSLIIGINNITSITLPVLTTGSVSFKDTHLTTINLPAFVSGSFQSTDCPLTASLNLPNHSSGSFSLSYSGMTSLTIPVLSNGGTVSVSNNPNLASLNLPIATGLDRISLYNNPLITSINLSATALNNTDIIINSCSGFTSFTLPCTAVKSIEMTSNSQLTTVNAPNLSSGIIKISSNPILNTISCPNLINGSFEAYSDPVLANIDLTNYSIGFIGITGASVLQQLNFPNLVNTSFAIRNNPALASISFPNLAGIGTIFQLNNNHLPSAQVNYVLNRLLSIAPASGKNVTLRFQSPSAPPTGQGIIDKTTLISSGNTITTD